MIELLATSQDDSTTVSLDLIEDGDIELTLSAQDLRDYKARQGGFTQSFALPFTSVNNKFFQMYFDVDNDSGTFNAYKKAKAEISSDTIPQITGYLKLEQVQWKARIYKITVFSQVAELARELGSKKLQELDAEWMEGYDHNLTYANIEESWSRSLVTTNGNGADIVYPFVNYGGGLTFGDGGASDVTVGGGSLINDYYFRPFFRLKALFDRVLHEAGFYYDSTFLETKRFEEIYMSLANTKEGTQALTFPYNLYVGTGSNVETFTATASTTTPTVNWLDVSIEEPSTVTTANSINTFDVGQILDGATHEISIPKTGTWTFQIVVTGSGIVTNNNSDVRWVTKKRVLIDGTPVNSSAIGSSIIKVGNADTGLIGFQESIFLLAGQNIKFQIGIEWVNLSATTETFSLKYNEDVSGSATNQNSYAEIIGQPTNISNDLVGLRRNLPDMKQIDFIRGVAEMFNLIIEPDTQEPNKLYIEPYPDYLAGGDNLDWTSKLDLSKDVTIKPTHQFRKDKVLFEFADSEDNGSIWWRENRDEEINSYEYIPDDEFAEGEQKIKLPFGTMPFVNRFDRNNNNLTTILKSGRDNGAETIIDFEPFLAYLPRVNGLMNGLRIYDITSNQIRIANNYCIASPYNIGDSTSYEIQSLPINGNGSGNDQYDLSFGFRKNYGTNIAAFPTLTTFNSFWKDYIKDIYSPDARLMVAYFQLEDVDIYNLRLNAKIWVKDAYWRINKIQNHKIGAKVSTKIELLKLVDNIGIYQNCDLQIDRFEPDGQVLFTDGITSGLAGNQDCCEAFGFNWRESVSSGEISIDAGCYSRTLPTVTDDGNYRPRNGDIGKTGACCITIDETTQCYITTEDFCNAVGGTYQGDDTNCIDDGC